MSFQWSIVLCSNFANPIKIDHDLHSSQVNNQNGHAPLTHSVLVNLPQLDKIGLLIQVIKGILPNLTPQNNYHHH